MGDFRTIDREWRNAAARLEKEAQQAFRARLMTLESFKGSRARQGREAKARRLVDKACCCWVATGSWPLMDQELALFAWDRISHSRRLLGWLLNQGFRHEFLSSDQLLSVLLVAGWEETGQVAQHSASQGL